MKPLFYWRFCYVSDTDPSDGTQHMRPFPMSAELYEVHSGLVIESRDVSTVDGYMDAGPDLMSKAKRLNALKGRDQEALMRRIQP